MPTYAAFAPPSARFRPQSSSALLASTPPTISRALSQSYPFLVAADKLLGWLTWSGSDGYESFLLVLVWIGLVRYFEIVCTYFVHAIVVSLFALTAVSVQRSISREPPSLDVIVARLESLADRWVLISSPVVSLQLKTPDIARFVVTAVISSPVYITVSWLFIKPRDIVLWLGIFGLTWHSLWFRVIRSILLRLKPLRKLVFLVTGINFLPTNTFVESPSIRPPATTTKDIKELSLDKSSSGKTSEAGAVKFTFVVYENQRHWLGIGWTSNMLSYERAPWTDEFLNEVASPEMFQMPDAEGTGMVWHWSDDAWSVDLTNGGALQPRTKAKLTVDPNDNDGYVYYDNVWRSPTPEATFTKYTRRRRWVRTAVLAPTSTGAADKTLSTSTSTDNTLIGTPEAAISPVDAVAGDSNAGSTATEAISGELRKRIGTNN